MIMANTEAFDLYLNEYEEWFNEHKYVYQSELKAVGHFIPQNKKGIEIGIGSGRFSLPFGITEGVEPSCVMRHYAMHKGLEVFEGIAEDLPLPDESYDFALMVATICFVDDVKRCFGEVRRILKPDGSFLIGFVDKASQLGRTYEKLKKQNKFYRYAEFYSANEVIKLLEENNFTDIETVQTIFGPLESIRNIQAFKKGYGNGGFVIIKAVKS